MRSRLTSLQLMFVLNAILVACQPEKPVVQVEGSPTPAGASVALPIVSGAATPEAAHPDWVGTPASGSPARSATPLPEWLANGDLVYGDGLLWFLWENTKSRVWFPGAPPEDFTVDLSIQPELLGTLDPNPGLGAIFIVEGVQAGKLDQVYWGDLQRKVLYPLPFLMVPADTLKNIPTAFGDQYYVAVIGFVEDSPDG